MATERGKLTKLRCIAAKIETTTGTAIAVSATDAKLIVMNPEMTPDDNTNEREMLAAMGRYQSTPGADGGSCKFRLELTGSGLSGSAVPPWASVFLPACDWTNTSGTFSPTNDVTTITIAMYEDGIKRILAGCRGTFKITGETGKPVYLDFEFKGKYQSHIDVSLISPTFPTVLAPVFKGGTLTFGSFSPVLSKMELDAGNKVDLRESGNEVDNSGYRSAMIGDRDPSGSADPEAATIATQDWRGLRASSAEMALNWVIGSSALNTITIASAHMQVKKSGRGDRHGLVIDALGFQFNSAIPFTIAFS